MYARWRRRGSHEKREEKREKSPISFMILLGSALLRCVDPESKMKKARSEPELLNINQDDNKMEKRGKRKYFPPDNA
jgi:hypothetical protein